MIEIIITVLTDEIPTEMPPESRAAAITTALIAQGLAAFSAFGS